MRKYSVLEKLGEGSFANVHRCENLDTREVVAVKHLKQRFERWEDCKRLREVKSLTKLKHPNVIRCTEVILERNRELYLVFEYAPRNLWQLIKDETKPLGINRIAHLFKQLLEGIAYIHQNNFFHRDIKPENLLLFDQDTLKIADFGLAREIRSRPPFTAYVSTRWYRAPELLLQSGYYSSPIDLWAAGCILGEMFLRTNLFPGDSDVDMLHVICQRLGTFSRDNWPDGVKQLAQRKLNLRAYAAQPLAVWFSGTELVNHPAAQQLLLELLRFDPQTRVTAQQALRSGFIQQHESEFQKLEEGLDETGRLSSSQREKDVDGNIAESIRALTPEMLVSTTTPRGKTLTRQQSDVDIDAILDQLLVSSPVNQEVMQGVGIGQEGFEDGDEGDHRTAAQEECKKKSPGKGEEASFREIENFLDNVTAEHEGKTLDDALEEFLSSSRSEQQEEQKFVI